MWESTFVSTLLVYVSVEVQLLVHVTCLVFLPCWSRLRLRFNVSSVRRHKLEFVEHLPDSSRVWDMTTLSELRVKHFLPLERATSVGPAASIVISMRVPYR